MEALQQHAMVGLHCRKEWEVFLESLREKASPVISKYFHDPDDQQDVLSELVFRFAVKVLANQSDGNGHITSLGQLYLNTVENTIIDIDRSINGRKRIPADIIRHSPLEKKIYRRYYMQRTAPEAIIEEICSSDGCARSDVLKILQKMEWEMGEKARRRSHGSRRRQEIYLRFSNEPAVPGQHASPETDLISVEQREIVTSALEHLSPEDRLIMQCYYLEELKISEIADLLHLKRYRIAYRMLRSRKLVLQYLRSKGFHYQDLVD